MRINIALAISNDWFKYAIITATSILHNSKKEDDYYFYILSNKFTEDDKQSFYKLAKIRSLKLVFLTIDDNYFDGAIHDWLGVSASYRLRLQSLVKEDKILYMDSDIVAMQDVAEFYQTNIDNYYLAAVEDKSSCNMKIRINKLKKDDIFFNSGVQLINLKKFRENKIEEQLMEVLREKNSYTDQDAINDVCYGKILSLPLKYNYVQGGKYENREEEANQAKESPVLLHYWGKPWSHEPSNWLFRHWREYEKIYSSTT